MNQQTTFRGHVFNLGEAQFVAENRDAHVARTRLGSWFVYDEAEDQVLAALLIDDHDADPEGFAAELASAGFADVVVEHFPEYADNVLPEA